MMNILDQPCVCFSTNSRPRIAFPPIDCRLLVVADRLLLLIYPPTKSTMECQPTIYLLLRHVFGIPQTKTKQRKDKTISASQVTYQRMLRKELKLLYKIKVWDRVTCYKCPYYYLVLYRDGYSQADNMYLVLFKFGIGQNVGFFPEKKLSSIGQLCCLFLFLIRL